MQALSRPHPVVYLTGGGIAAVDRRLALFLAASILLHLLPWLDWGFDSGRRPAQAPLTITARLVPAAAPAPEGVLARVEAPTDLPEVPPEGAPGAARSPSTVPVPEPVPAPMPATSAAPSQTPAQPGVERDGAPDLNWYTGRDLDILPRPLAPIEPVFPPGARLREVSGKVTLALSIDAAGRVVDVSVVRAEPPGVFDDAALTAFRAASFAPGIRGGRAVRSRIQTVVVFEFEPR